MTSADDGCNGAMRIAPNPEHWAVNASTLGDIAAKAIPNTTALAREFRTRCIVSQPQHARAQVRAIVQTGTHDCLLSPRGDSLRRARPLFARELTPSAVNRSRSPRVIMWSTCCESASTL